MRILVRKEDFSTKRYELTAGKTALELVGEGSAISFPYSEVRDFCVTHDNRGKSYFTMLCGGRMYEGQIIDVQSVEPFITELKEKLGGSINIEVRK
ncbi:MAG: hypothetical protein PHO41_11395 [Eubacteriales bacterium]|nr:hypothetical protein [Eubacteriales bacterium]